MYFQTNHTIKNPCSFDKNKNCNDYITNHNKKYHLFSIKNYFHLIFNHIQTTNTNFISTPPFFYKTTNKILFLETEFYGNDLRINLEDSLHQYIDKFLKKKVQFLTY